MKIRNKAYDINNGKDILKQISSFSQIGILIAFLILFIALSFLSNRFFTVSNLLNVARQISITGLVAIGSTIILISGGIDLSVGSVLALTGCISAGMMAGDLNTFLAICIGLGVGALVGLFNGFVISKGKIEPFIATLAVMIGVRGLAYVYTGAIPISNLPKNFAFWGRGFIGPIPVPVILLGVTYYFTHILLNKTVFGRRLYVMGGNEETAKLSGINVEYYRIIVYVLGGITAAMGGLVLASRLNSAQAVFGENTLFDAITAAILGGTSLNGGKGTVVGTLLGLMILGILQNGMNLLMIPSFYQMVVKGVVLLLAVWIDKQTRNN